MWLGMKTLIFCAFTEKSDVQGGVHKKPIQSGGLPKNGAWMVCRFKGGAWQEIGRGHF